ncbi:DUF895 domain membrane protein [Trichosporon asahii var. asahii CBS 8904]|uniref:DUF895 domain membrane protein n=1 Tax=Trichosporon asahii var. asahii (strain CBS 8904) TaxID=1220162 RepID=K1VTR5_TRIAC|nr:DUF895 domain membrane protein [Trichosporon asahii var. asahii CBS 8904]
MTNKVGERLAHLRIGKLRCLVSGSINNILGPRLTLSIGATGYALQVGSYLAYKERNETSPFVIVAGAYLGFTAAMLWSAQGAIMMAYPMEKDKGRSFSLFWVIFSLGGVVGACIALGIEARSTHATVSTPVFVAFIIVMCCGIGIAWLILPPNLVVRGDKTVVEIQASISVRQEIRHFIALFKDWRMLFLFPMFFTSNYYYAYQGSIIAFMFNARTRALASLITQVGAMTGATLIGTILDRAPGTRRTRALVAWTLTLILELGVWSGAVAWQVQFKRTEPHLNMDWSNGRAPGPLLLLLGLTIVDACFQGLAYYIMSSMTNDSFRLARLSGFYKSIQSAGAAVSYGMEAVATPYLTELIVSWKLILFSLPMSLPVILRIKDSNYIEEQPVRVEDINSVKLDDAPAEPAALPMLADGVK